MISPAAEWLQDGKVPNSIVPVSVSGKVDSKDEYVVLMIATDGERQAERMKWDNLFLKYIKSTMKVTLQGRGKIHNKSHGTYRGFGWSAKYSRNGNASYGRLATKKGVDGRNVSKLHNKVIDEIMYTCDNLNNIIPGVVKKGQSVATALLNHSQEVAPFHQRLTSIHEGLLTGFVCENAYTIDLHVEDDCTYTLIGFPFGRDEINENTDTVFQFAWKEDVNPGEHGMIEIILHQGTCIYYNGYGIIHHQVHTAHNGVDWKGDRIAHWNVVCYSNRRFFDNVMKSFERMTE